jgi:hypothetical protein
VIIGEATRFNVEKDLCLSFIVASIADPRPPASENLSSP